MPLVDLIDETYVAAPPAALAARLRDPALWRAWWPDLELTVFQDRGDAGVRWTVTGALVGTSEVWLEPAADGTVLHYYLRADPTARRSATRPIEGDPRRLERLARRIARAHAVALKRRVNALKDELEAGRPVGMPPAGPPAPEPVKPDADPAES